MTSSAGEQLSAVVLLVHRTSDPAAPEGAAPSISTLFLPVSTQVLFRKSYPRSERLPELDDRDSLLFNLGAQVIQYGKKVPAKWRSQCIRSSQQESAQQLPSSEPDPWETIFTDSCRSFEVKFYGFTS